MVELLWFIQTSITLGGNEIHQAPWIKEKVNVRWEKDGLILFFYFFILFYYSFRIFRIPEFFTEQINDENRSKPSYS